MGKTGPSDGIFNSPLKSPALAYTLASRRFHATRRTLLGRHPLTPCPVRNRDNDLVGLPFGYREIKRRRAKVELPGIGLEPLRSAGVVHNLPYASEQQRLAEGSRGKRGEQRGFGVLGDSAHGEKMPAQRLCAPRRDGKSLRTWLATDSSSSLNTKNIPGSKQSTVLTALASKSIQYLALRGPCAPHFICNKVLWHTKVCSRLYEGRLPHHGLLLFNKLVSRKLYFFGRYGGNFVCYQPQEKYRNANKNHPYKWLLNQHGTYRKYRIGNSQHTYL